KSLSLKSRIRIPESRFGLSEADSSTSRAPKAKVETGQRTKASPLAAFIQNDGSLHEYLQDYLVAMYLTFKNAANHQEASLELLNSRAFVFQFEIKEGSIA